MKVIKMYWQLGENPYYEEGNQVKVNCVSRNYLGISMAVPEHLKYIATDGCGNVHGFEKEPHVFPNSSIWWRADSDEAWLLGKVELPKGKWETSLEKVA